MYYCPSGREEVSLPFWQLAGALSPRFLGTIDCGVVVILVFEEMRKIGIQRRQATCPRSHSKEKLVLGGQISEGKEKSPQKSKKKITPNPSNELEIQLPGAHGGLKASSSFYSSYFA